LRSRLLRKLVSRLLTIRYVHQLGNRLLPKRTQVLRLPYPTLINHCSGGR